MSFLQQMSYTCPGLHTPDSRQEIGRRTFGDLFRDKKRLIIPLFQRRYCWQPSQWELWWNDVHHGKRDHLGHHNTGNVVIKPNDDTNEYIIIDGQQRLTTTMICIAAIRDQIRAMNKTENDSNSWIFMKSKSSSNKLTRILPSYLDRSAYFSIMNGKSLTESDGSKQFEAYEFFRQKAAKLQFEQCMEMIMNSLFKTSITQVIIRNEINMPQVFLWLQEKTLFSMGALLFNPSPGENLTAGDLVRNLMMGCVVHWKMEEQERFYHDNWLHPIETKCPDLTQVLVKFNDTKKEEIVIIKESDIEKMALNMTKTAAKNSKKVVNILAYSKFYSFYEYRLAQKVPKLKSDPKLTLGQVDVDQDIILKVTLGILKELSEFVSFISEDLNGKVPKPIKKPKHSHN
jgi:hypothetical protein